MVERGAEKLHMTAAHCRHTRKDTTFTESAQVMVLQVYARAGAFPCPSAILLEDTGKDLAEPVRTTRPSSLPEVFYLPLT